MYTAAKRYKTGYEMLKIKKTALLKNTLFLKQNFRFFNQN